ncbi:MAG TPA: carboxypeptidase-like regulatory domain-containing protein, partial [Vicinamibacterales bacterium]
MILAAALVVSALAAPDLQGRVLFSGVAVPGASVSATQGGRSVSTTSDEDGAFHFDHLDAGAWTIRVEMRGFATVTRDVTIPADGPPLTVTLTMRSYEEIVGPQRPAAAPPPPSPEEPAVSPLDLPGLVNGSVINGAVTPFAQPRAFGNNRPKGAPLYSGAFNVLFGDSSWNARPYSFSDTATPIPSYSDLQSGIIVSGPLRIPRLVKYGPQTVVSYSHGVTHSASTQSARMPTAAQRLGDFSLSSVQLRDPATGLPFEGNVIPSVRIAPQARSLLQYYPLPNSTDLRGANYQAPVVTGTTRDVLQIGTNATIHRRHTLAATLAYQRTVDDSAGLFGFEDRTGQSSLDATATWSVRFTPKLTLRTRYGLTRGAANATPFFANRVNVSADAGIAGNNQNPENWGPPTLAFPSIADLSEAQYQRTGRLTYGAGGELIVRHGLHTVTFGGDARRHAVDVHSQPDPRGTLSFTGFATGDAFADFLLGLPAASSLASSGTSTRLRGASYDAYFTDDWRVYPTLTLTLGVRWEYEAPFTERSGHLVNLDVA